jgi:uncharacterized LabA/DUF88 family protein
VRSVRDEEAVSYTQIDKNKLKQMCQNTIDFWPKRRDEIREEKYKQLAEKLNTPTFFQKLFKLKKELVTIEQAKAIYWSTWENAEDIWDNIGHDEYYICTKGIKSIGIACDILKLIEVSASDTVSVTSEDLFYLVKE